MTSPFSFHFLRKWGWLPTIFQPVGTDMRGSNIHTLCFLREAISSSYLWSHAIASLHWVACQCMFNSNSYTEYESRAPRTISHSVGNSVFGTLYVQLKFLYRIWV